jgi:pimeloyl-ACP methyl ester carboxylesterase
MNARFRMAPVAVIVLLASACTSKTEVPVAAAATTPAVAPIPYGANAAAGQTFVHDGVTLYYETYGAGQPLVLVHGNGLSIGSMAAQIAFFKEHHRVIAMDSRDHGRSSDSQEPLTYEKMTDDLAALIDHLNIDSADIVGWSDGGIEALLLGIRHPAKVRKIVSMSPNLFPGRRAFYKETDDLIHSMVASMPDDVRNTPEGRRELKVTGMMLKEPNIDPAMLTRITAPTLMLAGDHDVIRLEHIVDIFNHLPNGQLGIFPNSTHAVPFDDPALFNAPIERFLSTPFVKLDRIADVMKSLEKLQASLPK